MNGGDFPAAPVPELLKPFTTIGGLGKVDEKRGNQDEAPGEVLLPVANCGCWTPGFDGGTGAAAIAGPTSTPGGMGTGALFGGTGGKTGAGPPPWPKTGGGTIGVKAGK